jgi:PAS domain-containing protein
LAIAKSLDILLRAPTSKLDADLKRANALAKGFFASFKGLAAAALGGFTVASVVGNINKAFRDLDATAKRALKLDIDVQSARGLELAADLSGLAVDKLTTSYAILTKQIAAANAGGRVQQDLFAQLGIDAQKLGGMGAADQFAAIAKQIDAIADKTRRADMALKVFGKSGLDLLPLMANQGKGIADAMRDAQRLGGFISTAEAGRVEAANDAFSRLTFTVRSLFQRIAIDMAPALTRLFTIVAEGLRPGTALNSVFLAFGQIVTLAINIANEFAGLVSFLSQGMGTLGRAVAGAVVGLAAYIAITKAARLASISFLAVQKALLVIEKGRALINPKTAVAAAAAGVAVFVFAEQINAAIENMLGLKAATAEAGAELADFEKIQARATAPRKLNVASAQFGTQAALEQLLTVRSERQGLAQVAAGINESNDLLGQIRDGINAAQGIVGGAGFDEAGL